MDFGDILNQWENSQKSSPKQQNNVSRKKANAGFIELGYATKQEAEKQNVDLTTAKSLRQQMEEDSKKKINPTELWLRRYGVIDKDKAIEQYEQNKKLQSRDYVKDLPVDGTLDLHGLTRDEAWGRMSGFTQDCVHRGFRKIMFIHGKGNHSADSDPVLGELVRLFIEKTPMLGASGHPGREQGGSGATWVMIKNVKK